MSVNMTQTAVDSLVTLVVGGTFEFWVQLRRDGLSYDLRGKTVTATVRQLSMDQVSLGTAYDNIPCSVGNQETAAIDGGVTLPVTLAAADCPVPTDPTQAEQYLVRFYVASDHYRPQLLLFGLSAAL